MHIHEHKRANPLAYADKPSNARTRMYAHTQMRVFEV